MSKHTPGPWTATPIITGKGDRRISIHVNEPFETAIGYMFNFGEVSEANARLIAAAPDLLEACKGITDTLEAFKGDELSYLSLLEASKRIDRLRAAIAKATT